MSLCKSHIPHCWKSHAVAHFIVFIAFLIVLSVDNDGTIILLSTHWLQTQKSNICKFLSVLTRTGNSVKILFIPQMAAVCSNAVVILLLPITI